MGMCGTAVQFAADWGMRVDQLKLQLLHRNLAELGEKLGVLVGLSNINGTDQTQAGRDVAMQIAAMNPLALSKDDVAQDVIDRELEIGREQVKAEGKPEHMLDKIAQGKLNKFFAENTLLSQKFVKDNSVTIEKYLDGVSKGLTVSKFKRVSIG